MTINQVAELHNIDRQTIHRWLNEYKVCNEKDFLAKNYMTPEQELEKLKRQLKQKEKELGMWRAIHEYLSSQKGELKSIISNLNA